MARSLHYLQDLRAHGIRLLVRCLRCQHQREFDPEPVLRYFLFRRWPTRLGYSNRFRCTMPGCRSRDVRLMLGSYTREPPLPKPSPVDPDGSS